MQAYIGEYGGMVDVNNTYASMCNFSLSACRNYKHLQLCANQRCWQSCNRAGVLHTITGNENVLPCHLHLRPSAGLLCNALLRPDHVDAFVISCFML